PSRKTKARNRPDLRETARGAPLRQGPPPASGRQSSTGAGRGTGGVSMTAAARWSARWARTDQATAPSQTSQMIAYIAVWVGPETATQSLSRMVRALVSRISPPTADPRARGGTTRTIHAAMGAATTPAMSSATAQPRFTPAEPSPTRNPALAARATRNSLVSMEPMNLRGSIRPLASRAGVPTGPQPPPPVASTNPPNRPSGTRKRRRTGLLRSRVDTPQAVKRMRMYTPRTSRIADITGLAVSVDRLLKKVAPAKAPI